MCETINRGWKAPCVNLISGYKAIIFLPEKKTLTLGANNLFEGVGLTGSLYRYELGGDGSQHIFDDGTEQDKNNYTSVYTQTLSVVLPGYSNEVNNQIKILAASNPIIFLERWDDTMVVAGFKNGMFCTSVKINGGGDRKGLNGYSIAWEGTERDMAPFVGATGIGIINGLVNDTNRLNS